MPMFAAGKDDSARPSERPTALHSASQTETGLANSAIMMRLLNHLMAMDLLSRADVKRLLEGAAEDLLADGNDKVIAHQGAARLIRDKLLPTI